MPASCHPHIVTAVIYSSSAVLFTGTISTSSPPSEDTGGGSPLGVIIGSVVGALTVILVLSASVLVICCLYIRVKRGKADLNK